MSTGPSSTRWTHIALPVRNLQVALEWYLEWTPLACVHERADDDGRTAWLGHDDQADHPFVLVLLEKTSGFDAVATTLAPLAHLGFEVISRAEVDAIAARAEAAGTLAWAAGDLGPPVGYICAVSDPDGNIIEFSHEQGVYEAARAAAQASVALSPSE